MAENGNIGMRLRRLQASAGEFDAVIATSLENTYYYSGSYISTIRLIPNRLALLLVPRDDEPSFVVCGIEESLVKMQSPIQDVRPYVEFAESPVERLAEVMREKGLAAGRIGIEGRHLPTHYHRQLGDLLPEARIEAADGLLDAGRAVKDAEEIEALRHGARVTEEAIYTAWSQAGEGTTERAIAEGIMEGMVEGGAETLSFMCFAGGVRCSHAHPIPGEYRIGQGDLVRVDVGGLFRNYQSDVARTGVLGTPTPKQTRYYEAIFEGQRRTIEAMRPGTLVSDLYKLCKKTVEEHGIPFRSPHIGHCVGIGLHEEPIIHPFNEVPLRQDMVFYVEPFVLVPGRSAYHVEDLVRVTADGGEVLTDPDGTRQELFRL